MVITVNNIPEAKIRNAIWYLKHNKTKKFVCEFLGLPYNVKKLDNLIIDFRKAVEKEIELRKANRAKTFTQVEKRSILQQYLAGDSQSKLAEQYYITPKRLKDILCEMGAPIRSRNSTKIDHITQDLNSKLSINNKAFFTKNDCYVIIDAVYDEEYLDFLQSGSKVHIETYPFNPKTSKFTEPVEGIHYEVYWFLPNGSSMKLNAVQTLISSINTSLERTGREYYRVWRIDDESCFYYANRDELYPMKEM